MNDAVIKGLAKASMMKEALASCQIEGIGEDITLQDLYLAELKSSRSHNKKNGICCSEADPCDVHKRKIDKTPNQNFIESPTGSGNYVLKEKKND